MADDRLLSDEEYKAALNLMEWTGLGDGKAVLRNDRQARISREAELVAALKLVRDFWSITWPYELRRRIGALLKEPQEAAK